VLITFERIRAPVCASDWLRRIKTLPRRYTWRPFALVLRKDVNLQSLADVRRSAARCFALLAQYWPQSGLSGRRNFGAAFTDLLIRQRAPSGVRFF
jgi:hypothetical protein